MSRLLLSEGEDLHLRWRPHFASALPQRLLDLLWLVYGLGAFLLQRWLEVATKDEATWSFVATAVFVLCACVHAFFAFRNESASGVAWAIVWAILGAGVLTWDLVGTLPMLSSELAIAIVGSTASVLLLVRTEFARLRRVHFLTNRRLILRSGVVHLTERTLEVDRIQSVRGVQGPMGQMFGYGTLYLSLVVPARRKPGDPSPTEEVPGVPAWDEAKHKIEILIEERRLPPKERQKRIEERRLRDSMRALANWASPPQRPI